MPPIGSDFSRPSAEAGSIDTDTASAHLYHAAYTGQNAGSPDAKAQQSSDLPRVDIIQADTSQNVQPYSLYDADWTPADGSSGNRDEQRQQKLYTEFPPENPQSTVYFQLAGFVLNQVEMLNMFGYQPLRDGQGNQLPPEPYPHGINKYLACKFMTATCEDERQAALSMLEKEVSSGRNESAAEILKSLRLVDAVADFESSKASGNTQDQQAALRKLAGLEANDQRATARLDRFAQEPGTTDGLHEKQVKWARLAGQGESAVVSAAGAQFDMALHGNSDQKASVVLELQLASLSLSGASAASMARASEWLATTGTLARLKETTDPVATKRLLNELVSQSQSGNSTAKEVLGKLGISDETQAQKLADGLNDTTQLAAFKRKVSDAESGLQALTAYQQLRGKSVTEILSDFPDQSQVQKARQEISNYATESLRSAEASMNKFLAHDGSPAQRAAAIKELEDNNGERLKNLVSNDFGSVITWAKASDDAQSILESNSPVQMASALNRMLADRNNNSDIAFYLSKLDDTDKIIKQLEANDTSAMSQVKDKLGKELNGQLHDHRVELIVHSLNENSTVTDWAKAEKSLSEEAQTGNRVSADYLQWATAQREVAQLAAYQTDPAAAAQKLQELVNEVTKNDNGYARATLATIALNLAGSDAYKQVAGSGDAKLEGKPLYSCDLTQLKDSNPEAFRKITETAANSLCDVLKNANTPLTRPEAACLAAALSSAHADHATELEEKLTRVLRSQAAKSDQTRQLVSDGIFHAMQSDLRGNDGLVSLYMKMASDSDVRQNFGDFATWAGRGDRGGLLIMSCLAGSGENQIAEQSDSVLLRIGTTKEKRESVFDALIASYNFGNPRIFQTLGKVAGQSPDDLPDRVRETLHQALEAKSDGAHSYALSGMVAAANHWNDSDLHEILSHRSPDVIAAIQSAADKMQPDVRQKIISCAIDDIYVWRKETSEQPESERVHQREVGMQTLVSMAKYLSAGDIEKIQSYGSAGGLSDLQRAGLKPESAQHLQIEAEKALISCLGKPQDKEAKNQVLVALESQSWPSIPGSREREAVTQELREALIKYVQDKPFDSHLRTNVDKLVYDLGLPEPISGLLHRYGVPGSDEQLRKFAQNAIENYSGAEQSGEKIVRDVLNNVVLYNSLPLEARKELSTTGAIVDTRVAIGMMANGTLDPSSMNAAGTKLGFLVPPPSDSLDHRIHSMQTRQFEQSTKLRLDLGKEIAAAKQNLDDLASQTKDGVGLGNRAKVVLSLNINDSVRNWEKLQGDRVDEIGQHNTTIADLQSKLALSGQNEQSLDFSVAVKNYEALRSAGNNQEADIAALNMIRDFGEDSVKVRAPQIWKDFSEAAEGMAGRSAMQRLYDAHLTRQDKFPDYYGDFNNRFKQALTALTDISGPASFDKAAAENAQLQREGKQDFRGSADLDAIRRSAMSVIDTDQDLNALADVARVFNSKMPELQQLYKSADGTKYDKFVEELKTNASQIHAVLESVSPEQLMVVNSRIGEMEKALKVIGDAADKTGGGKDHDATYLQLSQKIEAMKKMVALLDPQGEQHAQLIKMFKQIESRDFTASTFGNWLKENAVIIGVTAVAVGMTIASMGTATPLAVVLVSSAVMVATPELVKEGTYLFNHYVTDTGLGKFDERSRAGQWGVTEIPKAVKFIGDHSGHSKAETASAMGQAWLDLQKSFATDVALPYLGEYALNVACGLATMGILNVYAKGMPGLSSEGLKEMLLSKPAGELADTLGQAAARAEGNQAAQAFKQAWMESFAKELRNNVAFTAAQETAEKSLQEGKIVGEGNAFAGFLLSTVIALGHAHITNVSAARAGRHGEAILDPKALDAVLEQCKRDGDTVTRISADSYAVKVATAPPDAQPIIVRRDPGTSLDQPSPSFEFGKSTATEAKALPIDQAWLSRATDFLSQGRYEEACQEAARDHKVVNQDIVVKPADLKTIDGLVGHLKDIRLGAAVSDNGTVINNPRSIVDLSTGERVDILHPEKTVDGNMLSGKGVQEIAELRASSAGQRLMAEHALCMMEEGFHVQQEKAKGAPISKTYSDYLEWLKYNNVSSPIEVEDANGRTKSSKEQEVVAAMYDAGMPVDVIARHFEGLYPERSPLMDYIRAREATPEKLSAKIDGLRESLVKAGADAKAVADLKQKLNSKTDDLRHQFNENEKDLLGANALLDQLGQSLKDGKISGHQAELTLKLIDMNLDGRVNFLSEGNRFRLGEGDFNPVNPGGSRSNCQACTAAEMLNRVLPQEAILEKLVAFAEKSQSTSPKDAWGNRKAPQTLPISLVDGMPVINAGNVVAYYGNNGPTGQESFSHLDKRRLQAARNQKSAFDYLKGIMNDNGLDLKSGLKWPPSADGIFAVNFPEIAGNLADEKGHIASGVCNGGKARIVDAQQPTRTDENFAGQKTEVYQVVDKTGKPASPVRESTVLPKDVVPAAEVLGKIGPGVTPETIKGVERVAAETGAMVVIFGSRQTGISEKSGQPYRRDSDIDIGVVGVDDFERVIASWDKYENSLPGVDHFPMRIFDNVQDALDQGYIVIRPKATAPAK